MTSMQHQQGPITTARRADAVRRRGRRAAIALGCAILAGCASAPPPPPPPPKPIAVQISLVGADDLNPNRAGRASPVAVRLYQLRDATKFSGASFDDLTQRADATLAAALISHVERMVDPGSTVPVPIDITPDARALGIVVEYSDLANANWRGLSPVPADGLLSLLKSHQLVISLERQAVTVTAPALGKDR